MFQTVQPATCGTWLNSAEMKTRPVACISIAPTMPIQKSAAYSTVLRNCMSWSRK